MSISMTPSLARLPWHEVRKVEHYWLEVDALTQPLRLREGEPPPYGSQVS